MERGHLWRRYGSNSGDGIRSNTSTPLSSNQLEAVKLLGVLAEGGPQFVAPLCAASVDRALVACLQSQHDRNEIQLTLRALRNLACSSYQAYESDETPPPPNARNRKNAAANSSEKYAAVLGLSRTELTASPEQCCQSQEGSLLHSRIPLLQGHPVAMF